MSLQTFHEYAKAFEQAMQTDDWSVLEDYFTRDATYEITGGPPFGKLVQGRDNILISFTRDVEAFDRRFDERTVELSEPAYQEGSIVHAPWRATYKKAGLPDLVVEGEEQGHFEGGRMCRLVSVIDAGSIQETLEWLASNAAAVGIESG